MNLVALLPEIGEFGFDVFDVLFGVCLPLAGGFDAVVVEGVQQVVALLAFVGQPLAAFLVALGERFALCGEILDPGFEVVDLGAR